MTNPSTNPVAEEPEAVNPCDEIKVPDAICAGEASQADAVNGAEKTTEGAEKAVKGDEQNAEGAEKAVEGAEKAVEGDEQNAEGAKKTAECAEKAVDPAPPAPSGSAAAGEKAPPSESKTAGEEAEEGDAMDVVEEAAADGVQEAEAVEKDAAPTPPPVDAKDPSPPVSPCLDLTQRATPEKSQPLAKEITKKKLDLTLSATAKKALIADALLGSSD